MATKNATIRLPEDLAEWLTRDGKSINQAVIECAQILRRVRQVSTGELRGIFTPDEWKFLADSFNGTWVGETYRCSVAALIAHVEDSATMDYLDKKWGVDIDVMKAKIHDLHGANVEAIYTRIEVFWASGGDIEEWAKY